MQLRSDAAKKKKKSLGRQRGVGRQAAGDEDASWRKWHLSRDLNEEEAAA